jgi:hypothetical protein
MGWLRQITKNPRQFPGEVIKRSVAEFSDVDVGRGSDPDRSTPHFAKTRLLTKNPRQISLGRLLPNFSDVDYGRGFDPGGQHVFSLSIAFLRRAIR